MIEVKRGNALAFYGNFVDSEGDPIAMTGLKCQMRGKNGVLAAEFTITSTATPGRYLFSYDNTDDLLLGIYQADIRATISGKEVSSSTFEIEIVNGITRD